VECSQRGLKLTSPGFRSKDEGFESDSESLRSIKLGESLDLSGLMDHLEISKEEKETESGVTLSSLSSGTSLDNSSISSSSNLHVSDDSNSSSGNGSDSDEFCAGTPGERSPYWETLPNLSSFQSYPIEDLVFCHSDALHPSTLVWVVRHLAKMMALVTAFRTRAEAEELFQRYRDLRLTVKPVKHKMNPMLGIKVPIPVPPAPNTPAPPPPSLPESQSLTFNSLLPVYPTEVLHESQSKSQIFSREPKSLDFDLSPPPSYNHGSLRREERKEEYSPFSTGTIPRFYNPLPPQSLYGTAKSQSKGSEGALSLRAEPETEASIDMGGGESDDNSDEEEDHYNPRLRLPPRPQRKLQLGFGKSSKTGPSKSPVLLVPLKNESVTTPKSSYPKEAYLYHVLGRSSSTFAPYQRSLNFIPPYAMGSGRDSGTEYLAWANSNGRHLLVPFSSWAEHSEMSKGPGPSSRNMALHLASKSGRRGGSKTSTLTHLSGKGTAKILLRDSAGHNGMWATLSQRFKRNFRDSVMPKLNGMWTQPEPGKQKKKPNKKVTFNAWATVQMV
jgi:hypothetical protein